MINVTFVITSESCTDGKYNQSSLSKRLSKTVTRLFLSIYYFLCLIKYLQLLYNFNYCFIWLAVNDCWLEVVGTGLTGQGEVLCL